MDHVSTALGWGTARGRGTVRPVRPSVKKLGWVLVATLALEALPSGARAAEPVVVAPPKQSRKLRRESRKDMDMSKGGTQRGILEFTLGSLTAAGALALIGRGAWELVEGRKLEDECSDFTSEASECGTPNPSRDSEIAAGLSFGLAVPMAIASGFLFARGARIHRDYETFRRANPELSLIPRAGRHGGGLTLRVRF